MGKPRPNEERYFEVLRRMTPEQRLDLAFALGDAWRERLRARVRGRFPWLDEVGITRLLVLRAHRSTNRERAIAGFGPLELPKILA